MPLDPALCESEVGFPICTLLFTTTRVSNGSGLSSIDIDRTESLIRSSTTHFTEMITGP
jgi:hypothetical protein